MVFNAIFAIASTGFAGMALEIILIFSFQNLFGYIYQKIGIVVSLFMVGLALGSLWMNSTLKRRDLDWMMLLGVLEVSICLFGFFLPQILMVLVQKAPLPLEPSFYMLVGMAGLLAGFEFPLVSRILIDEGLEGGSVAGKVDSFDHLGACLGAALTGTLLVPILGTGDSCALVGMLKVASILFLAIFFIFNRKSS